MLSVIANLWLLYGLEVEKSKCESAKSRKECTENMRHLRLLLRSWSAGQAVCNFDLHASTTFQSTRPRKWCCHSLATWNVCVCLCVYVLSAHMHMGFLKIILFEYFLSTGSFIWMYSLEFLTVTVEIEFHLAQWLESDCTTSFTLLVTYLKYEFLLSSLYLLHENWNSNSELYCLWFVAKHWETWVV